MPQPSFTSIEELMQHVQSQTSDFQRLCDLFKAGTLDQTYDKLKRDTVEQLMLVPMNRLLKGLPLVEDPEVVRTCVEEIAELLAALVDKTTTDVHREMMEVINQFPADDVRQSTVLRQTNMLN